MTLLIIFGLILLFLWGLVELSKAKDREEHNRIMEEKEISDNRKLTINIKEEIDIPDKVIDIKKIKWGKNVRSKWSIKGSK